MVLPGISGGTIKLVLGRYEPTVWSIGQSYEWIVPWESAAPVGAWGPILLPYVVGAVVGLVLVSNALKWLLKNHEPAMAGLLLGVLWGSALAIWPRGVFGDVANLAGCALAAALGFGGVLLISHLGGRKPGRRSDATADERP